MSLEIFYHAVKDKIDSRFAASIAALHFSLINNGFKCLGSGETIPTSPPTGTLSDMLPENWYLTDKKCVLIYWSSKASFYLMLKVFDMDSFALVHAMKEGGSSITDLDIEYDLYLGDSTTTYNSTYTRSEELLSLINDKLLGPALTVSKGFSKEPKGEKGIQGSPPSSSSFSRERDFLRGASSDIVRCPSCRARNRFDDDPLILPSGRCDLDPLAAGCTCGGGGMTFDPLRHFRPGRPQDIDPLNIPPGSVPPGARFDPTMPPIGPGHLFGPDPTRPPGRPRNPFQPDPDEMRFPRFGERFF